MTGLIPHGGTTKIPLEEFVERWYDDTVTTGTPVLEQVLQRLTTLEWLHLHPGAREIGSDAPDWFLYLLKPEDLGGPWYELQLFNRVTADTTMVRFDMARRYHEEDGWCRTHEWHAVEHLQALGYIGRFAGDDR